MKNILLITFLLLSLTACGTLQVSKADKQLIAESKKALLMTDNPEPLMYFTGMAQLRDAVSGKPVIIDIIDVDGLKVEKWYKVSEEVALDPGIHAVTASCTFENFYNDNQEETHTQTIDFEFEGGKKYVLKANTYFEHCEVFVEPVK